MSYNFLDKSGLTYFWDKIKGIFLRLSGGTMTGQLKTSFKSSVATGSYNATGGTLANICQELRYSSGCMGSVALSSDYSGYGCSLPSGWYNFLWMPHRSGGINGVASGDNCDYGTLLISGMNNTTAMHRVRFSGGAISDVKKIDAPTDYIANSNFYVNTHPENAPVLIPFIHNDIAYLLKRGGSRKIYYDGVEQNLDINNVFDGSPSYWAINPTGTTEIIIELTLHKVFVWTNTIYCDFGASGWRAKNVKIEVMNTNYESDVWTSKYNTTANGSGNVKTTFSHTPVGASNAGGGFNKIRFTFSNWNNATIFRISQLGVYNYGSNGVRETYMSRGIDDYVFRNITPNNNNTFDLGSSSNKWANVYATTFQGNATSATKATQDSDGNAINTTYYKASNPNGYTSNAGTITGIKMNGASKGTSGVVDLGTVITAHQDISGKQDKLTAGSNIQIANNTISATDTKYTAGTGISISSSNVISATSSGGVTFDDVYPVGSIYMSVNNTNPSTLFGGTWEQLKDRFLLGAGDTYTGGNTGGEATHKLTKAELPNYTLYSASHSHTITSTAGYNGNQANRPSLNGGNNQGSGNSSTGGATITVTSGGSDTPHNNMPPYLVVYMWQRVQ